MRYSAEELTKLESETDWKAVKAVSQDDVESQADQDEGPLPESWETTIMLGTPETKQDVHIRLDRDVLRWFKAQGRGYQTRINSVLRAFVQSRQHLEFLDRD